MVGSARQRMSLSSLLLSCVLLASCGGPDVPLTGVVVDAYTGKPVAAAQVSLGSSSNATDASGRFQLNGWNPKGVLEVRADGYEAKQIPLEQQPQLAQPTPPAATLDTVIRPNVLRGKVMDAYGQQPVAGALVKLSDAISTTTSTDGSYALAGVPESFQLTISAADHDTFSQEVSRTTSLDAPLRPNILRGVVKDSYSNTPLANATVKAGTASTTTGADGAYTLENVPTDATVEIIADGYATLSQPLEQNITLDASLRPDVLKGTLVDSATGKPVQNATVIATPALNAVAIASVRIDDQTDGAFRLEGLPEQGFVQVLAPGYKKAVIEIKAGQVPNAIQLEPFAVKALYVTAAVASNKALLTEYFDLIDRTELNTIIVDLKSDLRDDLGLVYYDSQVPMVKELGTSADYMDVPWILAEAKKRNIYTIARVQLFSHDNALADARPEWAVKDLSNGEVYADYPAGRDGGIRYAYLDPTNTNVWDYNIQLGVEAAQLGFDEVNFDYIRFTDWYGDKSGFAKRLGFSKPIDPATNPTAMYETITDFMRQAHPATNNAGAFMSVDVFGRVVLGPSMTIAQDITRMAEHSDYVAPMIYPSLWWGGAFDVDVPVRAPYQVIKGSLESSKEFFAGRYGQVRPWLQDHTDPWSKPVVEYGPAEVRAQIDATHDFDPALGWMLYNSANIYTEQALKPQ